MNKRFMLIAAVLFSLFDLCGENISFSAGSMKGTIGNNNDVTELSGNAYVLTETMEIAADSIQLSGENFRYIEATGSIKGKNIESKMEFSCGLLKYDRETKVAELKNNVTLVDSPNNVSAKAQMIEYNQKTEIAVMQIDVELKQKENVCSSAYAIYRKTDKMLELSGNAQIKQKDDTFRAQEITLNMDTQEISLDGRVKGSIVDERKSSDSDETEEETEGQVEEKSAESGAARLNPVEEKSEGETKPAEEKTEAAKVAEEKSEIPLEKETKE